MQPVKEIHGSQQDNGYLISHPVRHGLGRRCRNRRHGVGQHVEAVQQTTSRILSSWKETSLLSFTVFLSTYIRQSSYIFHHLNAKSIINLSEEMTLSMMGSGVGEVVSVGASWPRDLGFNSSFFYCETDWLSQGTFREEKWIGAFLDST